MNNNFVLAPCKEPPEIYEVNKKKNQQIAKDFADSKTHPFTVTGENITSLDSERIIKTEITSKISYGPTTTLGKSGCAVFAAHQGLRIRKSINLDLEYLASTIASQGYYYQGKGTFHCLFDHLGCSRLSSIQDLIDYLSTESYPVITALMQNNIYLGRNTGRHFINVVGITNLGFLVDDSEFSKRRLITYDMICSSQHVTSPGSGRNKHKSRLGQQAR